MDEIFSQIPQLSGIDDFAHGVIRSKKEELRWNFCRAYEAWVTAEHAEMGFYRIQEYWDKYVEARDAWEAY